jgi:hypothetical protein
MQEIVTSNYIANGSCAKVAARSVISPSPNCHQLSAHVSKSVVRSGETPFVCACGSAFMLNREEREFRITLGNIIP